MEKKFIILISVLIFFSFSAFSLEIPTNYKLQNENDYKKYESTALDCLDWLYSTPMGLDKDMRSKAQSFLIQWISGTNLVSISLNEKITAPLLDNPEVLMIYLGECAKFQLIHKKNEFNQECNYAGIISAINFYKSNKAFLKKSPGVDNYLNLYDAGTLKEYLAKFF